ncbi:MAG: RnfABCDGE type electron transport complex subunit A [Oscillospiraceae bacterium]|jgi:electron transport complex protein RnfA|nr:RnfABCDGE type electron transport complex subunit A [Oscillospiraceae bacterium]
MDVKALIVIMMSAVLVNNYVLSQFLGICPFLGASKELKSSVGMGFAVIFVMLLATTATWPIQTYLLERNGLGYLQTVVFILIIAALVQLVEIVLRKYVPTLYTSLGVYLPLMATNCAILGVTIANIQKEHLYLEAVVNALGAGLGFLLAMVIFSGIREHTENADPPPSFKGIPVTLFSAAILSLAFFGFSGVIENMFGS